MHKHPQLQGLYAITNEKLLPGKRILTAVEQAIDGGCRVIQFRDKSSVPSERKALSLACQTLCSARQVTFIVNDDVELALAIQADGVHIGKEDSQLQHARSCLGDERLIGVSCYDDFELALAAEKSGADYVAFGSFYASTIKPNAVTADINLLIRAQTELHIPVVAIGGITHANAQALIAAGADMIAVISAVFAQTNISASAQQFSRLFNAKPASKQLIDLV